MGLLDAPAASLADNDRRIRQRISVLPAPVVASRPLDLGNTITDAGRCCKFRHVMVQEAGDIRLVYANYGPGDAETTDTIKVRAGIEYPAGAYYKVHFPGEDANRDVTLGPGQRIISDPIPLVIPAAATFYTNTLVVPQGGGAYGVSGSTIRPGGPERCNPASTTDYTVSSNPGTGTGQFGYGPLIVLGTPTSEARRRSTRVLAITSDSFVAPGTGDAYIGNVDETGWAARAYSGVIGWINVARGGEQILTSWTASTITAYRHRMALIAGVDWVMCGHGTNDFSAGKTAAQVQAGKIQHWTNLAARGIKVRSHTIAPRTTSSDSWATTTGQTAVAGFGPETSQTVPASHRQVYNAWLRGGAPIVNGAAVAVGTPGALVAGDSGHPLKLVFDLAAAVEQWESTTSTWVWKAAYTTDGIHPNSTATTAIAASDNPAVYT